MSKRSIAPITADDASEAPLRQADVSDGRLVPRSRATGGALLPRKHRINIFLDGSVVEHFKAKAGARGYQTLINETLRQAIQADSLEAVVRRTIREELRRA
jgi:uncharacterized protein (DUF4415 family)